MIDSKFRGRVQPYFDKTAHVFIRLGSSPNGISFGAFLIGVSAGIMVGMKWMLPALLLLWLSGLLDVMDGTVARLTKSSSSFGAYMDLIFDRMVEAAIIMGFYLAYPNHALAYLLFFVSVIFNFTTFIVAGNVFENRGVKAMHHDIGLAERTETFLVFSAMMVMPAYIFPVLMVFNGIIFVTGAGRFHRIYLYEKVADGLVEDTEKR